MFSSILKKIHALVGVYFIKDNEPESYVLSRKDYESNFRTSLLSLTISELNGIYISEKMKAIKDCRKEGLSLNDLFDLHFYEFVILFKVTRCVYNREIITEDNFEIDKVDSRFGFFIGNVIVCSKKGKLDKYYFDRLISCLGDDADDFISILANANNSSIFSDGNNPTAKWLRMLFRYSKFLDGYDNGGFEYE
jgi:hypothetical protein